MGPVWVAQPENMEVLSSGFTLAPIWMTVMGPKEVKHGHPSNNTWTKTLRAHVHLEPHDPIPSNNTKQQG